MLRCTFCVSARPTHPVIYSEAGQQILRRTSPVQVATDLKLYCSSEAGDPAPSLAWRRAGVPLPAVGQEVDKLSGEGITWSSSDLIFCDHGDHSYQSKENLEMVVNLERC